MQALREDARERALAHVGFTDGASCGEPISTLVKEWDEELLTPSIKTVRLSYAH